MFTGIITDIGTIRTREDRGDVRLVIDTAYDVAGIDLGASIACSGACLTVVDKGVDDGSNGPAGWIAVDASAETLARTVAAPIEAHWGCSLRIDPSSVEPVNGLPGMHT